MTRRKSFGSSPEFHRANARSFTRETRDAVKAARRAARQGNCRDALHYLAFAAWNGGMAVAERSHASGPRRKIFRGGSHMGRVILGLQGTVFRACRIR